VVLPSRSVNRNVTVPVGRSGGAVGVVTRVPAASVGPTPGAVNPSAGRGADDAAGGVQGTRQR
jgi:hypothetical protein